MITRNSSITIHVDFPALADLVVYLREQSNQQKQIDDLAAKLEDLTRGLQQSNTALTGAVSHQYQMAEKPEEK